MSAREESGKGNPPGLSWFSGFAEKGDLSFFSEPLTEKPEAEEPEDSKDSADAKEQTCENEGSSDGGESLLACFYLPVFILNFHPRRKQNEESQFGFEPQRSW